MYPFEIEMMFTAADGTNEFYQEVSRVGLRDRIKYLSQSSHRQTQETNAVFRIDGYIVGVAGLWPNPNDPNVLWLPFLSVDPEFKHMGIGTMLAHTVADYAVSQGKILQLSSYTLEGRMYLKRVFLRLIAEKKYSNCIKEQEEWIPYYD